MREPVAAARAEGRDSRAEDKESVLAAILATVANDADIEIPFVDLEPSDDENDDNADAAGGSAQDRGKAEAARAQQDWTRSLAMLAVRFGEIRFAASWARDRQ